MFITGLIMFALSAVIMLSFELYSLLFPAAYAVLLSLVQHDFKTCGNRLP